MQSDIEKILIQAAMGWVDLQPLVDAMNQQVEEAIKTLKNVDMQGLLVEELISAIGTEDFKSQLASNLQITLEDCELLDVNKVSVAMTKVVIKKLTGEKK